MQVMKALERTESLLLRKRFLYIAVIASAGLAGYANSISVPFLLDDFSSIANNYAIQDFLNFPALWKFYANRIVLYFTLSVNWFIHGNAYAGYHIVNIAIHIINGMLVFNIARYLVAFPCFETNLISRYKNTVSMSIALVFITHPIQVNAVTYIIQRTASLAATFYFLAILFFIRYRLDDKKRNFVLVLAFTVLAMFTKENTITIPFMLLFLELMFFAGDGKTSRKKRFLVFFILFLTVPIIPCTNLLLGGYSQSDPDVTFKASTSMDRMHYFYTQLNVIILYIKLMFIPDNQNFDYSNDFPVSKTIWENNSFISFGILFLIMLFALYTLKRNRLVLLGIIWFFTGLSVESSFISIKDVYFEHRLYFSCAGFAIFIIAMVFYRRKEVPVTGKPARDTPAMDAAVRDTGVHGPVNRQGKYLFSQPFVLFTVITLICVTVFTGLTVKRNYIYGSPVRLWTDTVNKAPNSDRAHSSLATAWLNAYSEKEKNTVNLDFAEKEFKKAISLNYRNDVAHTNLSKVYYYKGLYDKCIEEAQISLLMRESVYARYNLALAYKKLNMKTEALKELYRAYDIDKRSLFVILALADTHFEKMEFEAARHFYNEYRKYSRGYNDKYVKEQLEKIEKLVAGHVT